MEGLQGATWAGATLTPATSQDGISTLAGPDLKPQRPDRGAHPPIHPTPVAPQTLLHANEPRGFGQDSSRALSYAKIFTILS